MKISDYEKTIKVADLEPGMIIAFHKDVLKIKEVDKEYELGELYFSFEMSHEMVVKEMGYRLPEVLLLWGSHLSQVREPGKRYFLGREDISTAKYEQDGEQFKVRSTQTYHGYSTSRFDVLSSKPLTDEELKEHTNETGPFGFEAKEAPLSDISVEKGFTHGYSVEAYTD